MIATASLIPFHQPREHYARFLTYWKDGDIDRDKAADARKKIGS